MTNHIKIDDHGIKVDTYRYWLSMVIILSLAFTRGEIKVYYLSQLSILFILLSLSYYISQIFISNLRKSINDYNFLRFSFYALQFSSVTFSYLYYGNNEYFWFSVTLLLISLMSDKYLPAVVIIFYFFVIRLHGQADIDVYVNNTAGVNYLIEGINPYSSKYVDIYNGFYDYSPGYLYWPTSLYLQCISEIVFGDVRYILAISWWISAFFFPEGENVHRYRRVWWLLPNIPYLIAQGWIDPLLSFFAALTLWALRRKNFLLLGISIGLAASTKQYGFLLGIFVILKFALTLDWRICSRVAIISGLTFLISVGPFVAIDAGAFIDMTISNHARTSIRPDSLNVIGLLIDEKNYLNFNFIIPFMTFSGFVISIIYLIKYRNEDIIDYIPDCWIIFFGISVLFGKFAFFNYYSLLVSFVLLSIFFRRQRAAYGREFRPV